MGKKLQYRTTSGNKDDSQPIHPDNSSQPKLPNGTSQLHLSRGKTQLHLSDDTSEIQQPHIDMELQHRLSREMPKPKKGVQSKVFVKPGQLAQRSTIIAAEKQRALRIQYCRSKLSHLGAMALNATFTAMDPRASGKDRIEETSRNGDEDYQPSEDEEGDEEVSLDNEEQDFDDLMDYRKHQALLSRSQVTTVEGTTMPPPAPSTGTQSKSSSVVPDCKQYW